MRNRPQRMRLAAAKHHMPHTSSFEFNRRIHIVTTPIHHTAIANAFKLPAQLITLGKTNQVLATSQQDARGTHPPNHDDRNFHFS
jgi:hypothetical protein